MRDILEGAEPFLLQGGRKGVLLIHGFTGSPAEMRLAGEFLHDKGYTVLAPRLCGHGTRPEEMASTNWLNWYHSVCDAYYLLQGLCEEISVVGLSMGGLLALKLGIVYPDIKNIVSISAPIYLLDRKISLLPPPERSVGRYVIKRRRKFPDFAENYSVAYKKTPLLSIHSLLQLIGFVEAGLPEIRQPLLVIHSKSDHTVAPSSAECIYQRCSSSKKELFWLQHSGHVITLDIEREKAFEKIASFFANEG